MTQLNKAGHTVTFSLVAAILGMAGSCILFAAYLAVPLVGLVSGMIAPFPILILRLRFGRMAALLAVCGATAALATYFAPATALMYLVQCGLIALLMPELLLKGYGASRSIAWTTTINVIAVTVAVMALTATGTSFNLHAMASAEIKQSVSQAITLYEQNGIKGEELDLAKKTIQAAGDMVLKIYPAIITISYIMIAGINLALVKRFSAALTLPELAIGQLKEYRTPEIMIWGLIASGFSLLASSPLVTIPAMNLLAICTLLYFLQGWGIVLTFIARQRMPGMLRVGLYVVLLLQPYLAALITIIGIFDLWGDFRTPKQQENL